MYEGWQKYSFAEWLRDGGAPHLFPDAFMERIHRFLQPYIAQINISVDSPDAWDHPDTIRTEVGWETSLGQTRSVLERISPDYADIFDSVIENNQIKITDVPAGKGAGRCFPDRIICERDGTLNDAVYLTHEFGHFILGVKGDHYQSSVLSEWQAYFTQHAIYQTLAHNKEWGEDIAKVAANHQRQELNKTLVLFPDRLRVLAKLQKGDISEEDKANTENYVLSLHKHTPAAFIALALFHKYKDATPAEQEKMRASLFETTSETTYESVLADFDLLDNGKLEHAMRAALEDIGITAPTSKPAMKHDKV